MQINTKPLKTLCCICHYFGQSSHFSGGSARSSLEVRKVFVEQAYTQLLGIANLYLCVCGVPGKNILPLDKEFLNLRDPRLLVYETLSCLSAHIEEYDYFLVVEDDIYVPEAVLRNIFLFDSRNPIDTCLLPNRMEITEGKRYCVDLQAFPGWTNNFLDFQGNRLCVARNPHSAFLLFSREKLEFCLRQIDTSFRERFAPGEFPGGLMASAFAHFHSPFQLYRPYKNLEFHNIEHLDHWIAPHEALELSRVVTT